MNSVNDPAVHALKLIIQDLHHDALERATTITTLRARINQLEVVNNNHELAGAEAEAPLLALNKITDYIVERTRQEREALQEPSEWGRTTVGNAVGHTLYADLCHQLDKIRREHGL